MLKQALVVGAAGIVAIALAMGGSSEPLEPTEANVAPCGPPSTAPAAGAWAGGSLGAGPLAVPRRPLARMAEAPSGQLTARMPVLLSGHRYVVLSVPLALRKRVFLYYGPVLDNQGQKTTSLLGAPGYSEIELQLCRDRPRTLWPGGVRVIGHGPVRLLVTVEGRSRSTPLPLGRPAVAARG